MSEDNYKLAPAQNQEFFSLVTAAKPVAQRDEVAAAKARQKDSPPAADAQKAPAGPKLLDLLNSVLGQRDVVMIGDLIDDESEFVQPPLYLIRGDVVATFEDRCWWDIIVAFNAELVSGTVSALNATVQS